MDLFSENINIETLEAATKLFKESRNGFLKLFNNSPICMSMTSTNLGKRTYVRVNKKFIEKFGFEESEIIGRTSVEIGILDAEESIRVGSIIKEKGRLQNDYVRCIAKDGSIVHTVSSIEMMDMHEETYLVSFFLDITKIMEQQTIIEQHVKQLEAVNKELEAFSYSVSHDLMAPLRAISMYMQVLEEDYAAVLDEEGKKAVSSVQRNANRMKQLIADLLSFARLGKTALVKADVDIHALVLDIMQDMNIPSAVKINIAPLHAMKGDAALIRQVFVNLLSNAVKYSSKKEHPVIDITSEQSGEQVVYTIRDNGEGFDMQYADKLFGIFQRLHRNDEFEGTGIGLANVQRIVQKHEGTIRAEAVVGEGATFTITFPAV